MDWIWIVLCIIFLFITGIVTIVMASGRLHPPTAREDEDQMQAISQYNEKRARRDARKKTRDET